MKRFSFLTLLVLGFISSIFSQLVVTDPPLPVSNQAVSVTFDATLGDGGLAGYTGDVYAHTGMITENSISGSDWKYVKTNWGQNSADTKLTRIGPDLYQLDIGPDIREYYGVPGNEEILQMAFVFRSGVEVGGSYLTGKTESNGDIFVDVYEEGLSVSITKPALRPTLLELNDTLIVEISANDSDTIAYFNNGSFIKKIAGTMLTDTIIADQYGKFWLKAIATNDGGEAVDSTYYFVRSEVVVEDVPAGIRDGINYLDGSTVVLCLPAPGKEYIFVIGDFSNWELGDDTYLKQTPDGERFWVEISGIEPGKEYVYQYLIDGGLKIADPYCDKISDPWNDQYIDDETYPGLIAYPDGKTNGIASVLQTSQPEYNWEVTNFTPPDVEDLVIYELLVRDFTEKHSYQAVIDTLDYLEKLGINVVELMPVNEFEGNISWGYNPSFYFAPDKYYGPREKLKELIDECHKRGMAVLIDLVLNHSFGQSPFVQMYFDGSNPTEDNPWYNVHSNFLNPDAQWGYDFNHESSYTQDLVDSVNSYWMSEYKFDGFRFDFTKGFSNNIKGSNDPWGSNYDADRVRLLKRMADEIWARNPNAIVSFEHLAVNSEEEELAEYGILMWGNMNHEYGESAMGYPSNLSYIDYRKRGWDVPHSLGYMHSHDEERLAYKCYQWGNLDNPDYNIKDTTVALERLQAECHVLFNRSRAKNVVAVRRAGL